MDSELEELREHVYRNGPLGEWSISVPVKLLDFMFGKMLQEGNVQAWQGLTDYLRVEVNRLREENIILKLKLREKENNDPTIH